MACEGDRSARPLVAYVLGIVLLLPLLACAEHVGMQGDDPELRKLSPQLHRMKFLEVLEADARIYLYHHFLTDEECDATKAKALSHLKRSGVVDTGTGGTKLDDVRTSEGMFFQRGQDPMIQAIEKRLSEWTLTAVHAGEGLQVLRYQHDQEYKPHWDYFFDDKHSRNGENRYATVLMYLEGAEEGGETVFPKVPAPHGQNANFSDCAKYNLAVKPKKGDAILFHSMKPGSGKLEDRSMHGACPVIKGEKWSMTKWIHASHYTHGNDKYDRAIVARLADQARKLQEHPGTPDYDEPDPEL